MEYKDTHNKPTDRNQSDNLIADAYVSDALRYAILDLWTVNPLLPNKTPITNFEPRPQNQQWQIAIIDDQVLTQLQVTPQGLTGFFPQSTFKIII